MHARHGNHYGTVVLLLHGVHVAFDASFLTMEARHHWGKKWWLWLIGVVVCVAVTFWLLYVPEIKSFAVYAVPQAHEHSKHWAQQVLIGGMLVCVLTRLLTQKVHSH